MAQLSSGYGMNFSFGGDDDDDFDDGDYRYGAPRQGRAGRRRGSPLRKPPVTCKLGPGIQPAQPPESPARSSRSCRRRRPGRRRTVPQSCTFTIVAGYSRLGSSPSFRARTRPDLRYERRALSRPSRFRGDVPGRDARICRRLASVRLEAASPRGRCGRTRRRAIRRAARTASRR